MKAQYESFIFSYEDYKESNFRRNHFDDFIQNYNGHVYVRCPKCFEKIATRKIRHRVGSDAITEVDDFSGFEKGHFLQKAGSLI